MPADLLPTAAELPTDKVEFADVPASPLSLQAGPDSRTRPDPEAEREPHIDGVLLDALNPLDRASSISKHGLEFIAGFEGYSFHAYWDAYGHVWTVGVGETEGVGPNTTMTWAQALADLKRRLATEYEPAIRATGQTYTQNQWDALCSFTWNLGAGSMQTSWTIGRLLHEGRKRQAADAMLAYDTAGGVVLAGLVRRRHAERKLFLTAEPPPPDPHHYKRFPTHGFRHFDERRVVESYDRWRAQSAAKRARTRKQGQHLHGELVTLRKHVWVEAHEHMHRVHGKPQPRWGTDWYGWRWQALNARAKGKRVVK